MEQCIRQGIKIFLLLSVYLYGTCLTGCRFVNGSGDNGQIKIVSWNVQTFFDAETSGLEYSQFRGSKTSWSRERYEDRLDRLCSVIRQLDADIFVMEEIENRSVMYDIMNRLSGLLYGDRMYRYMVFAAEPDSAIGCGVLSRLPLGTMSVHQIDNRTTGKQPMLRPLMEVPVREPGSGSSVLFTLYVCHWKSRVDGDTVAELWQAEQAALLSRRLEQADTGTGMAVPAVICGDFNRDISGFTPVPGKPDSVYIHDTPVQSGWLLEGTVSPGSYWYQDGWERLDHIFTAGNIRYDRFAAEASGEWAVLHESGQQIPYRYAVWNGYGYSDHLPVSAVLDVGA